MGTTLLIFCCSEIWMVLQLKYVSKADHNNY